MCAPACPPALGSGVGIFTPSHWNLPLLPSSPLTLTLPTPDFQALPRSSSFGPPPLWEHLSRLQGGD